MEYGIAKKEEQIYHISDTIRHKNMVGELFIKLLEKIDEPDNLINICFKKSENKLQQNDSAVFNSILQNTMILEGDILNDLAVRVINHDMSKFEVWKEYNDYSIVTPKFRGLQYGTPEHKKISDQLDDTFYMYHVPNNSHHPEHYSNGVLGMDLYDLTEMMLDWCSAAVCRGFKLRFETVNEKKKSLGLDDYTVSIIKKNIKMVLSSDQIEE